MMRSNRVRTTVAALAAVLFAAGLAACGGGNGDGADISQVAQNRGLDSEDVEAAVKTYVPGGQKDEHLMFSSGGHSGQVMVFGVPSMRLLQVIGVFTPEPWQGYGLVAGKLDPHVTVYSWEAVQEAIRNENFSGTDDFGVPILSFDAVTGGQVELGLGPLHTQYGPNGQAYTSLFIESAVAEWNWQTLEMEQKTSVHYNVGHLAAPAGEYVVSLNKWAIDRFKSVGPLHPQNFQLLETGPDTEMQVLYDAPIGVGEPHYAQVIDAEKVQPWNTYPSVRFDPGEMEGDSAAPASGDEGVRHEDGKTIVDMTAVRSHFNPERFTVSQGDSVIIHITNVEQARDATHGFAISEYDVNLSLEPGETETIRFVADQAGVFPFYCTEFCSALHLEMAGYMAVEPQRVAGSGSRTEDPAAAAGQR